MTIVGALEPTSTFVTNYAIYPFVGLLAPGQRWRLSEREVDAVLELSLPSCAPARHAACSSAAAFTFHTDAYLIAEQVIWGATARIVDHLLHRLDAVDVERRSDA